MQDTVQVRPDKHEICRRLILGHRQVDIARELSCAKSTVAYWKAKADLDQYPKLKFADWNKAQTIYDTGLNVQECCKVLGVKNSTWARAVDDGKIVLRKRHTKPRLKLEDLLCDNRPQTSRGHLKGRLIKSGLIKYLCSECGINEWREKRLSLVLDHINGIKHDNRITNLRLLCPNCNSLTSTFCGKNTKQYRFKNNIGT